MAGSGAICNHNEFKYVSLSVKVQLCLCLAFDNTFQDEPDGEHASDD